MCAEASVVRWLWHGIEMRAHTAVMGDTPTEPDVETRDPDAPMVVHVNADGTWTVRPDQGRPEEWGTEQVEPAVPWSVLAAESKRRPHDNC